VFQNIALAISATKKRKNGLIFALGNSKKMILIGTFLKTDRTTR
jgi:hypothetical protein